jgi:hypothetical protein
VGKAAKERTLKTAAFGETNDIRRRGEGWEGVIGPRGTKPRRYTVR